MAMTGNGEIGLDSGEGPEKTVIALKEGDKRANYPILTHGGNDTK